MAPYRPGRKPKRIDREKFRKAYEMLIRREIDPMEAVKISGISYYLLETRLRELMQKGYLPGEYFKDGLPFVLDFTGQAKFNVRDKY